MSAEFVKVARGDDVLVRGKRVPMLEAYHQDGGVTLLVFDRRIGLAVPASHLEAVAAFVADVMANVMDPNCGRTFNVVHEISGVSDADEPGESP